MILIEVTNVEEVVKNNRGWLAAKLGHLVVNEEVEVEKEIISELKKTFEENGIKANILSVGGVNLRQFELARWKGSVSRPD